MLVFVFFEIVFHFFFCKGLSSDVTSCLRGCVVVLEMGKSSRFAAGEVDENLAVCSHAKERHWRASDWKGATLGGMLTVELDATSFRGCDGFPRGR